MSNFNSDKTIIMKRCRLAWADIYTPGEGMNGGPPKFKVTGLFTPDSEASKIGKASMVTAARGLWGDNAVNVIRSMAANSKAIRSGNDKMDDKGNVREEYKDMQFISASNKAAPRVVGPKRVTGKHKRLEGGGEIDLGNEPTFVDIHEDGTCSVKGVKIVPPYKITVPYRGCYVNLKVQMVAGKQFTGQDKQVVPNQVYAKIEAVQFVEDGEAFGAGPATAEGFDDEEVEEVGSSGGGDDLMDDDVPF
jgi:hypothetical protein